ncbi:larval cuticle protein LCP-17-like [Pectinophora gossypiella]|nr:larval cuticle protein LCP-17-like [Pectinophora gossypiella]
MKFLILAACVCVAMAGPAQRAYQPFQAAAQVTANAAVAAAQVVSAPARAAAGVVAKAYSGNEQEAQIVRSSSDVNPQGFQYEVETGNGIVAQASGVLKKVGDAEAVVVQGAYKYTAPDGTPVQFTYVADENGYQPQSDLIPVGPPVPEAIARSIEYLRTHAPKDSTVY